MELHHPAAPAVHLAAFAEQIVSIVRCFLGGDGFAREGFSERLRGYLGVTGPAGREFKPVVARAAAVFGKEIVGLLKDIQQFGERGDPDAPAFAETFDIRGESRFSGLHDRVGTPGRTHDGPADAFVDDLMIFERIGGIVGRAHHADVHAFQEHLRTAFLLREDLVDLFPDQLARFRTQQLRDAEEPEIKMNPFVHGVSGDLIEYLRHGDELVMRRSLAGNLLLRHACFPQDFPHIMVRGGEKLPRVLEVLVARNSGDVGVVVRIEDGKVFDRGENAFSGFVSDKVVLTEEHGESFHLMIVSLFSGK